MSTNTLVNQLMGLTDDLIGGSSLMWRYHHQVTHILRCMSLLGFSTHRPWQFGVHSPVAYNLIDSWSCRVHNA